MNNSSDIIGNRTRDLLACSAVPQPTAPPRDPITSQYLYKLLNIIRVIMFGLYYKKIDTTHLFSEWSRRRLFLLIKLVKGTFNVNKKGKKY